MVFISIERNLIISWFFLFCFFQERTDSDSTEEEFLLTLDNLHIIDEERYCWIALRSAKRGAISGLLY